MRPPVLLPGKTQHNGTLGKRITVVDKTRKPEKVLRDEASSRPIEPPVGPDGAVEGPPGFAGKSLSLTIPGPERSYKSAKIEVWCSLPCIPSAEGVRAAYAVASTLINEEIQKDAQEITESFF